MAAGTPPGSSDPASAPEESVTQQVLYAGRVQGVGFRYTTREIARGFAVTGFVRNLPDGQVELQVQGASAEVERFLAAVAGRFEGNLRGIERRTVETAERWSRFEIRR